MSIIIDGTGTISGVSATGLTTAQTVTQSAIATGVAGTGPAFSAYNSSTTALTNSGYTKIDFQTEEFDTNNNFASSRFTPTVAGYYQLNASVQVTVGSSFEFSAIIYKNGTAYKSGTDNVYSTTYCAIVNSLVYLNGSTDYVEIYSFCGTSGKTTAANSVNTWFNGVLVRAA